ncbi:MAG TPA: DMT family transporter [Paracoccaceae bacterium]|nr:DMT family transporter [Paracoccaceae bacterium]
MRKDRIDALGATALVTFALLMGLNQVLIKLVNAGLAPAFQAGLRSACALLPVLIFARLAGRRLTISDGSLGAGIACGLFFSVEFLLLFEGLEHTTVSRASVLFYSMPVWVAVGAHFLIPGERLTLRRIFGLVLAVGGVALALLEEPPAFAPDALLGDLMCLGGAICWAGIALVIRTTRLSRSDPEMQLVYQLAVSGIVLLALAPLLGDTVREVTPAILGIFAFQVLVVVAFGILLFFWALRHYPASDMASFAFLAPLFGVLAGWAILDEPLSPGILGALALVGTGIVLVNWKPRAKTAPAA